MKVAHQTNALFGNRHLLSSLPQMQLIQICDDLTGDQIAQCEIICRHPWLVYDKEMSIKHGPAQVESENRINSKLLVQIGVKGHTMPALQAFRGRIEDFGPTDASIRAEEARID